MYVRFDRLSGVTLLAWALVKQGRVTHTLPRQMFKTQYMMDGSLRIHYPRIHGFTRIDGSDRIQDASRRTACLAALSPPPRGFDQCRR